MRVFIIFIPSHIIHPGFYNFSFLVICGSIELGLGGPAVNLKGPPVINMTWGVASARRGASPETEIISVRTTKFYF